MNPIKKLACIIALGTLSSIHAQFNHFETGIEAGPALGTFWSDGSMSNRKMNINYSSGAFFRFNFIRSIGVQTGIYFERIGTSEDLYFTDMNGDIIGRGYLKYETDYITFPLLAKFTVGKKLKIGFSLGTFFSYLLKARSVVHNNNPAYSDIAFDETNGIRRFNTGLVIGTGLDYCFFEHLNVGIEVRDQLGLYDLSISPSSGYYRTNSLQILFRVSYQFMPNVVK